MTTLSHYLDRLSEMAVPARVRGWVFVYFGVVGWMAGIAVAAWAGRAAGLSWLAIAALAGGAMGAFYGLTAVTKFVAGRERLVYYHHEIAVLLVTALVARWLGIAELTALDVAVLALGAFLTFGRLGCHRAGCCHGLPAEAGIAYRPGAEEARMRRHLLGVRLIPAPLIESVAVLLIVGIGVALFSLSRPGLTFAWYCLAYAWVRFLLEFVRGDRRPYAGPFSEAQWTSLAIASGVALSGLAGVAGWTAAVGLGIAAWRRRARHSGIANAAHIEELARMLHSARQRAATDGGIFVGETSQGIRVTASVIAQPAPADIFGFSRCDGELPEPAAYELARLARLLRRVEAPVACIRGGDGLYCMVLPTEASAHAV